jgi:hypothetical protein
MATSGAIPTFSVSPGGSRYGGSFLNVTEALNTQREAFRDTLAMHQQMRSDELENIREKAAERAAERQDFIEGMKIRSENRRQAHEEWMQKNAAQLNELKEISENEKERHNLELEKLRLTAETTARNAQEMKERMELARGSTIALIGSLDASSPRYPQLKKEMLEKNKDYRDALAGPGAGFIMQAEKDKDMEHQNHVKWWGKYAGNQGVENFDFYSLPTDKNGNIDSEKAEEAIFDPARQAAPSLYGRLTEEGQKKADTQRTTVGVRFPYGTEKFAPAKDMGGYPGASTSTSPSPSPSPTQTPSLNPKDLLNKFLPKPASTNQ